MERDLCFTRSQGRIGWNGAKLETGRPVSRWGNGPPKMRGTWVKAVVTQGRVQIEGTFSEQMRQHFVRLRAPGSWINHETWTW